MIEKSEYSVKKGKWMIFTFSILIRLSKSRHMRVNNSVKEYVYKGKLSAWWCKMETKENASS